MSAPAHVLAATAAAVPSSEKLEGLRAKATELAEVTARIENGEKLLKQLKERQNELQHRELPDLFEQAGTDHLGLAELGVDIVVAPFYRAGISAEWEPERREAGFSWLEEEGHGGVIKTRVEILFGREEVEEAKKLMEMLRQMPGGNSREITMDKSVHWGTLTSLVRELVERGEEVPLEKLGAVVGRRAAVKQRKK